MKQQRENLSEVAANGSTMECVSSNSRTYLSTKNRMRGGRCRMKKMVFVPLWVGVMMLSVNSFAQVTVIDSGYCGASGNNLTWKLTSDSVLTISGSGAMADYLNPPNYNDYAPWYSSHRNRIKTVIIGDSVTTIGNYAFGACDSLNAITLPNNITSIGDGVFAGCNNLIAITLPNNLINIGNRCFSHCHSLKYITIPNSVTTIGDYAFNNCYSLNYITIPESVTNIGNTVFWANDLISIEVSDNNPAYSSDNGVLFNKSKTILIQYPARKTDTNYIIPNSVIYIEEGAFLGCYNLTSVIIPNSVTDISDYAFHGCSRLTSLTIGSSVTNIGVEAFYGCSELKHIYSLNENPPIAYETTTFNFINKSTCILHVPIGKKNDYANADGWKEFLNIQDDIIVMPNITTDSLPSGMENRVYNANITATGYIPITWTLEVGNLPDGLNLSTDGVISGTPTTAGTFNFTIKAENSVGNDSKGFSIFIAEEVIPEIIIDSLPSGTVKIAYNTTLIAKGEIPISWGLENGNLPDGLNLYTNGTISGTPIISGIFNFTVKATNNAGSDTKVLSIVINEDDVGIANYELRIANYVIYPNPTTGKLTINCEDKGACPLVRVYNVAGQVVYTSAVSALSPETIIDISHLANGLYFLKVNNKMIKVIKQ